eukprot:TRINITY_DN560_c0_g1_i5.p2 TRINITY_DN560_c0_g1~~TRINITY_DN560_c0_g1_i5.p2  ORF type:complete len:112 (-),score=1.29 TRINITY_DN560_c0_g1_i5:200-535(-)
MNLIFWLVDIHTIQVANSYEEELMNNNDLVTSVNLFVGAAFPYSSLFCDSQFPYNLSQSAHSKDLMKLILEIKEYAIRDYQPLSEGLGMEDEQNKYSTVSKRIEEFLNDTK